MKDAKPKMWPLPCFEGGPIFKGLGFGWKFLYVSRGLAFVWGACIWSFTISTVSESCVNISIVSKRCVNISIVLLSSIV